MDHASKPHPICPRDLARSTSQGPNSRTSPSLCRAVDYTGGLYETASGRIVDLHGALTTPYGSFRSGTLVDGAFGEYRRLEFVVHCCVRNRHS